MKFIDIQNIFTKTVAGLMIEKNLIFSPTTGGSRSQGEIMKVDLTNGVETYRIRIKVSSLKLDIFQETVEIIVEKFNESCCEKSGYHTLWSDQGELISKQIFFEVYGRREEDYYTADPDEAEAIRKKQKARYSNYGFKRRVFKLKYDLTNEKNKKIVIKFIKRQPGCKSKTIKNIKRITKYGGIYTVVLDNNKSYDLK